MTKNYNYNKKKKKNNFLEKNRRDNPKMTWAENSAFFGLNKPKQISKRSFFSTSI